MFADGGERRHADGHCDKLADGEVDEVERVVGDIVGRFDGSYKTSVLGAEVAGEGADEELKRLSVTKIREGFLETYGH